jgi:DNA polymerase iota
MFRKLHPEKSVWNLSLINVAVTNMAETGGESKTASGRDIGNMLRKQEDVLKDFRVIEMRDEDVDVHDGVPVSETLATADDDSGGGLWDDGDHEGMMTEFCSSCGSHIPTFATVAHQRFHSRAFR